MTGDFPREWTLTYAARPWTTNSERKGHWSDRAARTAEWRQAFYWLAVQQRIPLLHRCHVTVEPWQAKRPLQDTGACHPAVKAAIDGIVDAGVLVDDTGRHLSGITFLPPRHGRDALSLVIVESSRTE